MPYTKYQKTEAGKKSMRISSWKKQGLISNDYNKIYDLYINTTNCDLCKTDLSKVKKCLEHNHNTGEFRNIVCNRCNQWKADKATKNIFITYDKRNGNNIKRYAIAIRRNGKHVIKTTRATEEEAKICLDNFIKENPQWFT